MARSDLETMIVTLEANLKQYLNGLAKAQGTTASAIKKMEMDSARGMARVERSFSKAGSAIAGFGKGLVIGGIFAAVAGLEELVRGSITYAAAIGDLSEKLGITSDKMQELQYGAVQANMGFEELESSLLRFSKSLGQARNGQGDLLKTLEANGFDKAKIKAMSYSEALDTVADLVKNAATEQDAMLIITQAFGKGGDEMLEFLRSGSLGLKGFGKDAHDAAAIIDKKLIKSAQEFDDMWARAMQSAKSQTAQFVANTISEFKKIKGLWERLTATAAAPSLPGRGGRPARPGLVDAQTAGGLPSDFRPPSNFEGRGSPIPKTVTKFDDPDKAKRDAEAFAQAQKDKSDAIKRLIDFSIENQQRAADVAEEAAERQLELDQELYDSKMALADAAVGALDAIIFGGEKASDVIKDLAQNLLKAAVQASLFGSGPFASLFGTGGSGGIFGSLFNKPAARASGGHVNAGEPYMVGERGRELFVPSQSGSIVPKIGSSGGTKVTVNNYAGVDVKTSQDSQGNPIIAIRKMVSDTIAGGFANSAMRNQFGVAPTKARR
jgi:hypothetical protein